MILGRVSYLDCLVFLLFLTPQLLVNVGFWNTLVCALEALPFLLLELPFSFLYERYITRPEDQTPFVQQVSAFEDVVIRCTRYAFANIPASIGRVFLSKEVALPFMRFRMLRHGYFKSPIPWQEVSKDNVKGIWMILDPTAKPDIVIFYAHGGGFAMGSPYFYLEFFLTLLTYLKTSAFPNPAIFALSYTLVPDAHYPTQVHEALAGYKYILSLIDNDSSKICVAGDSAGATIMLSLLLLLSQQNQDQNLKQDRNQNITTNHKLGKPALAAFISPWTTLHSPLHINTATDYLNASSLHHYSSLYTSSSQPSSSSLTTSKPITSKSETSTSTSTTNPSPTNPHHPSPSPSSHPPSTWTQASPTSGFLISYSPSELFGPSIRSFVSTLVAKGASDASGTRIEVIEAKGKGEGIHAWVVAALFLCGGMEERVEGIRAFGEGISRGLGRGRGGIENGKGDGDGDRGKGSGVGEGDR